MKRILPYILFFLCIGICLAEKAALPLLFLAASVSAVLCVVTTRRIFAALFSCMIFVGVLLVFMHKTDAYEDFLLENATAARENAAVEGVVTSFYEKDGEYVYKIKNHRIVLESGTEITSPYGIRLMSPQRFACGDVLKIDSRIYTHNGKFNPSDFDSKLYLKIHGYDISFYIDDPEDDAVKVTGHKSGIYNTLKNDIYALRERVGKVFDTTFSKEQAGVLKAITTGDKGGLDTDISDSFRNAGIYHFLAVSGLHLSVISLFIITVLGRINKYPAYAAAAAVFALYFIMTGGTVSVSRAVLMAYILLFSRLIYRNYDLINSTSAAALILLIINPLYIYDIGFLYSFGAVFGIALVMLPLSRMKNKNPLLIASAASLGASAFTCIITLLNYYTLNLPAVLTNIVLIPFMGLIVVYAFCIGFGGLFLHGVGLAALPLKLALDILLKISDRLAGISALPVGHPNHAVLCLVLVCALVFVLMMLKPSRGRLAALVLMLPLTAGVYAITYDSSLKVNFLYVGQGDCCVITKDRCAYIIDCGGNALSEIGKDAGRYRIMPFLDYSGVTKIKAVFISHTDTDHIKGLFDMIGNTDIENIYLSDIFEKNENYDILAENAEKYGIPIKHISAGESAVFGDIAFDCLFPFEYDAKDNNQNSMVLMFRYGKSRILFTGDINKASEKRLLDMDIKADILKLPHHGSKSSSRKAFIKAVSPEIAVASAGKNNYFGHPSAETLKTMREQHIPVYKTFDSMIQFKTDEGHFVLSYFNRSKKA